MVVLMAWKRVYHHGIYIDDDCVIEVVVAGINKCTYAEFKDGCPVYKIRYGVRPKAFYRFMGLQVDQVLERKYNRQETAARAIAFASSRHLWQYHLLLNNCEHFATWVVMGYKYSVQSARGLPHFWFNEWQRTLVERRKKKLDDDWDSRPTQG